MPLRVTSVKYNQLRTWWSSGLFVLSTFASLSHNMVLSKELTDFSLQPFSFQKAGVRSSLPSQCFDWWWFWDVQVLTCVRPSVARVAIRLMKLGVCLV